MVNRNEPGWRGMLGLKKKRWAAAVAAALALLCAACQSADKPEPLAGQDTADAPIAPEPAADQGADADPATAADQGADADSASAAERETDADPVSAADEEQPLEVKMLTPIAEIPEREITLYGKDDGVLLMIGGQAYPFDWTYLTPRKIMPVMQAADFDADGEEELAIILYVGSGTGVSVEELRIIEFHEEGVEADYWFPPEDYLVQTAENAAFRTLIKDGVLLGEIAAGSQTYHVNLETFASEEFGKIDDRLIFGDIVGFRAKDGKLTAEFGVGIGGEKFATPQYIGTLHAEVRYRDGVFTLTNFAFEPEERYDFPNK